MWDVDANMKWKTKMKKMKRNKKRKNNIAGST